MQALKSARELLEAALLKRVKEYGTSYEEEASYYSNEFGIEPWGDERIGQVYDFFSGQGCAYIRNLNLAPEKEWDDLEYTLILQLYTVIYPNGGEHLRDYAHYNLGTEYDAESCEVLHDSISSLALEELCLVLKAIEREEEGRG